MYIYIYIDKQTHAFLSYNRFHPRHIRQSIIYSQFLRYKRICANHEFFLNDSTKLLKYFLARKYPFSGILHNFNKVKQIDRHRLLSHTPKQQHKNICLITKFSPTIGHFIQSTKSDYRILKDWRYLCSTSNTRFQATSQPSSASNQEYHY